jgi:hypothetical protein
MSYVTTLCSGGHKRGKRDEGGRGRGGRWRPAELANSRLANRFVSSASPRAAALGSLYSFLCVHKPCKWEARAAGGRDLAMLIMTTAPRTFA